MAVKTNPASRAGKVAKKTAKPVAKNNTLKLKFDTSWTYAPAPESKSAATINKQYDLFIDGKWQKPLSKTYIDTINPATEEKLSEVAVANEADVNKAVTAARNAYEKVWKKMPAKERAKYIFRIARMVQEKARELSIIETLDGGKPIRESRDFDVPTAAIISFIMLAGPINWSMLSPTGKLPRWEWWDRLLHGIFRC